MDVTNYSEILHYKRGIFFIDKLLRYYSNNKYTLEKEKAFYQGEFNRFNTIPVASFDLNNFLVICGVALLGLNKEAIERSGNNKDYKYDIDYSVTNIKTTNNLPIPKEFQAYLNNFESTRITNTDYDEWLSVNHFNALPNYQYNHLFNVRNAFMHSGYSFDMVKEYRTLIANIKNDNFTNYSAKIYLPKYFEFLKHYFYNDPYFGLVENLYCFGFHDTTLTNINDEATLLSYLTTQLEVKKLSYENNLKPSKIIEKRIERDQVLEKETLKKYNATSTDITLEQETLDQALLAIKSYFGNEFYTFDLEHQQKIIIGAIRYNLDPKAVISSWITHLYTATSMCIQGTFQQDDFNSLFALQPSLLILKAYTVLYRLQNKALETYPLDYSLMNKFDFDYELNHYNDFKLYKINDGLIVDEEEYKIRYFCDVLRDSLCHGNVKTFFKEEDDGIKQYFHFTDKYKSRERNIIISTTEFEKFLSSDTFNSKHLTDQDNKIKVLK